MREAPTFGPKRVVQCEALEQNQTSQNVPRGVRGDGLPSSCWGFGG
ncbi:MAG TPA: hypothetical protein V6C88_18695 [Chroococcidiopsis sp.]